MAAATTIGPFMIKSLEEGDKFRFTRDGQTFTYIEYGEYADRYGKKEQCPSDKTQVYLVTKGK
jgi:hypothetical protein